MGNKKVFTSAKMSIQFLISTICLIVLMLGLLGFLAAVCATMLTGVWGWVGWITWILLTLGSLVLLLLIWTLGRPARFEVSSDGLEIIWPGRTRKLPKAAFYEINSINTTELGPLAKKGCISGVFGCFGWVHSKYLSNIDAYITRYDGLVFVRLKNRRPLLLTPAEPEIFINELLNCINAKETLD